MVEGAVHQQFPQNIRRTGEAAGIEIHWQIQKDADAVEQAELFQLPPHTSPVIPAQKVPSGHQKEWDCHPGQYPGKPEISHGRHIRQGRGVVHHHQQDCRQTKEVQSRDGFLSRSHGYPPHHVRINPSTLSPDIWQQPSGTSTSVTAPAAGT